MWMCDSCQWPGVAAARVRADVRRQRTLAIELPRMAHGDADRMADLCEHVGRPLVPWQRDLLRQMESASIAEQFNGIVRRAM
ncbi:hypothetical protein AWB94_04930 [Mycolicibacterium canariasense]|nr:hypothetical protein AWB94_04930 [Mycolicibacterium canariasense]